MKRLLTIIMLLVSVSVFGQIGRLPYKTLMQTYRGDTCKTTVESDTVHYYTDLDVFDFNKPITINGASPFSNFWMQTGSDIYFNTGNVGIGLTNPLDALHVNGLLRASTFYTDTANHNTIIGNTEWESSTGSYNIFIGDSVGAKNSTGSENVVIGQFSGKSITEGSGNVIIGSESGTTQTDANNNVLIGYNIGQRITTGSTNVMIGTVCGAINEKGAGNVYIGYYAGANQTDSSKLIVNGIYRGSKNDEILKSLIYGQFDSDTLNQFVDINGMLRHTATTAEIYRHVDSTARTQSIPNGTTPTKIVVFSDNGVSSHCTADAANDKITITKPGIYDVKLFISYSSGTNNVNWLARLFLGGSAVPNIHSQGNTSTANQFRSTALGGKIKVTTVPIDLDYRVVHDYPSAVNLTFVSANLNVNYEGE